MRLDSLALKGLLAFDDEVRLDLRALPPGIIAITGPNGAGKTTLMEAPLAAIFRSLISRGEKAPLTDYCGDHRDAYIDATWSLEGRGDYRTRVSLDGLKGGSEAVLERLSDGRALNDGKVSTYDVAVAQVFPSRDVLLASAYAAQNRRGSFITLGKGDRKDLFASLLGLDAYGRHAETARKVVGILDTQRAGVRALLDRLDVEAGEDVVEAIAAEANTLQAEIGAAEVRAEQATGEIANHERALEAARADATVYAAALEALNEIRTRRMAANGDLARAAEALTSAETLAEQLRRNADNERTTRLQRAGRDLAGLAAGVALDAQRDRAIAGVDAQLAQDRADREERLRNNRALADDGPRIRAVAAKIERRLAERNALRSRRPGLLDFVAAEERELTSARRAHAGRANARMALAQAERAAGLLGEVPCGGAGDFAGCQFLQDARQAREQLAALRADVAALEQAERDVVEAEKAVAAARENVTALDAEIATADADIAALEREGLGTSKVRSFAELLATLAQAEQRITDLEKDLAQLDVAAAARRQEIEAGHQTRVRDRATRLADLQAEQQEAEAAHARAIADIDAKRAARVAAAEADQRAAQQALDALDFELTFAEAAVDAAAVDGDLVRQLEAGLTEARTAHAEASRTLAALTERARHLDARRTKVMAQREEAETLRARAAALDQDRVEWDALARIFGKDGLPVLEIDAAGPHVSALTNDLLQACFGARFVVELVTQQAKKDGKGLKEAFDLKVWDAERPGRDRDVSDLSGGEQVIVDEAIKSAIALYLNERNETPIRTCWRDETTGPLSTENITRYMQMLRRVFERGGFVHLWVVTHSAEAAAMADYELRVEHGRLTWVGAGAEVAA